MNKKKPKPTAKMPTMKHSFRQETWKTWVILIVVSVAILGFIGANVVTFLRNENTVDCAREMAMFLKALEATRQTGGGLFPAHGADFTAVLSQLQTLKQHGPKALTKAENSRLGIIIPADASSQSGGFIPFLPQRFACPSGGTYSLAYPANPKTPDEVFVVCSKHGG
ncbi:MAG: hypothetical protein V2A74_01845, partial [bacterium]